MVDWHLLYHPPDDLPDDTILIQALKRGLIDQQAIMTQTEERNREKGKVIPISVRRKADAGHASVIRCQ